MLQGLISDPLQLLTIPRIERESNEPIAYLSDAEMPEPSPDGDPGGGRLPRDPVRQQYPLDRPALIRNHGCILVRMRPAARAWSSLARVLRMVCEGRCAILNGRAAIRLRFGGAPLLLPDHALDPNPRDRHHCGRIIRRGRTTHFLAMQRL